MKIQRDSSGVQPPEGGRVKTIHTEDCHPIEVLALDLEGTLISNAASQFARPGLLHFLEFCWRVVPRRVIYTGVSEERFRAAARTLVAEGSAPPGFELLEYISWEPPHKDLSFVPGTDPTRVGLLDDSEDLVRPDQKACWIPIRTWEPPYPTDDTELERVREVLERRTRRLFTIGYGGRKPSDFVTALQENGIRAVADIRLRPDRASMPAFKRAKVPEKGIHQLLTPPEIDYLSLIDLGNVFLEWGAWREPYGQLLELAGDVLTRRLLDLRRPFCLLCAERDVEQCHRKQVAEYLVRSGWVVTHIL